MPGSYTVTETLQAGWVNSTPISIDFDLVSGENEIDNNFLNYRPASKSGYKYEDVDGSGTLDGGDLALENWEITLTGTDGGGNAVNQVTSTNANGYYEFTNLVPGSYTVTETLQAGWVNSTPISIDFDLVSGENEIDNNFLNYQLGSIHGYKYEDANGNGVDDGEPRMAMVTFELVGIDGMSNPVGPITFITGENGEFLFVDLTPGSYTITELGPTPSTTHPLDTPGQGIPELDVQVESGIEYVAYLGESQTDKPEEVLDTNQDEVPDLAFGNRPLFYGCTPGFWKNNADKKEAVAWPDGVSPDQSLESIGFDGFMVDPDKSPGGNTGDDATLLEALQAKGGGEAALMRAAVAAVLNALHPDVDYELGNGQAGADAIIATVNATLAGEPGALSISELATLLDDANNAGCSVDQHGNPTKDGDFDLDGDIDMSDLITVLANYTGSGATGRSLATGDSDGDSDVDMTDLITVLAYYTGSSAVNSVSATAPLAVDAVFMNHDFQDDGTEDILSPRRRRPFVALPSQKSLNTSRGFTVRRHKRAVESGSSETTAVLENSGKTDDLQAEGSTNSAARAKLSTTRSKLTFVS